MNHFFAQEDAFSADHKTVVIRGDDAHHIMHVLRMKVGEEFSVSSTAESDTAEYRFGIVAMEEGAVTGELRFIKKEGVELPARITLFQGLPKADKMELITQKAVELGVAKIVPVACERSIVKLAPGRAEKKVARLQAIANAAAKQSRRGMIPEVSFVMRFQEACALAQEADVFLLPYELAQEESASAMEETREVIRAIKPESTVAVFVGPEGGFSKEEVQLCKEKGASVITLGRRILRTETAGMALLSWLVFQLES